MLECKKQQDIYCRTQKKKSLEENFLPEAMCIPHSKESVLSVKLRKDTQDQSRREIMYELNSLFYQQMIITLQTDKI